MIQAKRPKAADAAARKARSAKAAYVPTARERRALGKLASRETDPLPFLKVMEKSIDIDHPNPAVGLQLLCNALGTSDQIFALGILQQLEAVCGFEGELSERGLNFMLSIVRGVEPRDQLEATLAVQMAVIHHSLIELRATFSAGVSGIKALDILSEMNKLARTYTLQMDTLKRYRSKGEQRVTVQHVTVSEGGQAIVGDILQANKEAGAQPNPPALIHSEEQPMAPIIDMPRQTAAVRQKSKA